MRRYKKGLIIQNCETFKVKPVRGGATAPRIKSSGNKDIQVVQDQPSRPNKYDASNTYSY